MVSQQIGMKEASAAVLGMPSDEFTSRMLTMCCLETYQRWSWEAGLPAKAGGRRTSNTTTMMYTPTVVYNPAKDRYILRSTGNCATRYELARELIQRAARVAMAVDGRVASRRKDFKYLASLARASGSEEGVDIKFGSLDLHVPSCSAHHPLVQMLLFARYLDGDKFSCPKSMVPRSILDRAQEPFSPTSQNNHEAARVPAKHKLESPDAEISQANSTESSNGRSNEARTSESSFTAAGTDCKQRPTMLAPTPSLQEQNSPENRDGSNGGIAPTNFSANKDVVRELDHDEPADNKSVPDSSLGERGVVKAEDKAAAEWKISSRTPYHVAGDSNVLTPEAGGPSVEVSGTGSVVTDKVVLPKVRFIPGFPANLVSVRQLAELGYSIMFSRGVCYVRNGGSLVGKAYLGDDGSFQVDYLKVPLNDV